MSTDPLLLVSGASGQLGRAVLDWLLDEAGVPAARLVATTRSPQSLADLAARGVQVRAADFDRPETLDAAFAGATRLLLVSTDALLEPGQRLRQQRNAVDAAVRAGVQHVVYTSMPAPEPGSPLLFAPDHHGTEQALAASALPGWTVLRNAWYFENLFLTLGHVLESGHWYSAAGDGRIAHIARADLAEAAARVLAGDGRARQVLTLTGSEAFTTRQIAALVAQVAGKPIEVVDVPVAALEEGMRQAGLPGPLPAVFASFDSNTAAGGVAAITGDFQAITGRAPLPYREWLERNRAAIATA